ncbi:MAG: hypothetical protein GXY61_08175 [Lentisphaerae bacterium]|nr:hypothetical protein [Lentisphaerota bacterium]
MKRKLLATTACMAIILIYSSIGGALGWENGGGIFMHMILFGSLAFTWILIIQPLQEAPDANSTETYDDINTPIDTANKSSSGSEHEYEKASLQASDFLSFECPHCTAINKVTKHAFKVAIDTNFHRFIGCESCLRIIDLHEVSTLQKLQPSPPEDGVTAASKA